MPPLHQSQVRLELGDGGQVYKHPQVFILKTHLIRMSSIFQRSTTLRLVALLINTINTIATAMIHVFLFRQIVH